MCALVFLYISIKTARTPLIHTHHRSVIRQHFENAFASGAEVFYLSIMSQHTLKEMESRLEKAQNTGSRINILTLDPDSDQAVIEAIRIHLNEPPYDTNVVHQQIRDAWRLWSLFAEKYSIVRVRKYRSIPTLQGVLVRDKYLTLELIPYNTQNADRPGIFLTQKENSELFILLQERFIRLWESQKE